MEKNKRGILNGFDLKLIAAALMVLDHILYYFPGAPICFGYLGRIAAPIFFYLAVEGFFHTKNRSHYMARLFGGALTMYAGSRILTRFFPTPIGLPNNILLSLGLGVALMSVFEWMKKTNKYWSGIPVALAIAAVSLATEASLYGVAMICIFYFFRNNTVLMAIMYVGVSLIISLPFGSFSAKQMLLYDYQWMMVLAAPFFFLYNGERGPGGELAKWFFYLFYPVHLWIIYVISYYAFWA